MWFIRRMWPISLPWLGDALYSAGYGDLRNAVLNLVCAVFFTWWMWRINGR